MELSRMIQGLVPTFLSRRAVTDKHCERSRVEITRMIQVPKNHILTQNLYYKYCSLKLKYLIIGYLDPLGEAS